ncbi:MAG TPA: hypothetical protein GX010_02805 [Erysipelotrichaceae bacterium]|nr:hypothetical protein [Erysipelotrichaceae bacterium]
MEECQRQVDSYSVSRSIYLMSLFDWRLVKEEKQKNGRSSLHFERDETVPYYHEMVKIEEEMIPKLIPLWIFFVLVGLAFACVTVYLILFLVLRSNFSTAPYFYIFFVPAMVLLFSATVLFYFRSRQILKFLESEKERVLDVEKRMLELKERYGNQKEKS